MRSTRPKVLHPIAGRPMIDHVLTVARRVAADEIVVVVSPRDPELRAVLDDVVIVDQQEPLGTGHAVLQTCQALRGRAERVLVLLGDGPLIRAASAARLVRALDSSTVALLTAELADPNGYGRIVRQSPGGAVLAIVEQAVADEATRAIREVWSGQLAVRADWLWKRLPELPLRPGGEYYLTDLVEIALNEGEAVSAVVTDDPSEAGGINSQFQLAVANRLAWDRECQRLMAEGVTILDPATTYVEAIVEVGPDTVLHPNTHLQGRTRIGKACQIGPNSIIVDSTVGDRSRVWSSVVEGSALEADVQLGPFSHVRPGSYLEQGVQLGNFAETKNSHLGRGTQMHHMSYVGDADVGARVNIGAGTVTCNYDGQNKHRTEIGEDAFVGSDSMLIAPVRIGARARTGAGSVVTRDVPDDATVAGVPARPFPPARPEPERSRAEDGT